MRRNSVTKHYFSVETNQFLNLLAFWVSPLLLVNFLNSQTNSIKATRSEKRKKGKKKKKDSLPVGEKLQGCFGGRRFKSEMHCLEREAILGFFVGIRHSNAFKVRQRESAGIRYDILTFSLVGV